MTRDELANAYAPVPEGFHGALVSAVRHIKEEEPVKKRHIGALSVVLALALLCGTALALVNYYSVRDYQADGAPDEAFEQHITAIGQTFETKDIKAIIGDAVFDGRKMALTMNLYAKDNAKRVFLYPTLEAYCGQSRLNITVGGMRGLDESGFLFPGGNQTEDALQNAYAMDVSLTDDTADSDVTWVFTLRVLAPNWEIVDCPAVLRGEADDLPVEQYSQLFRDAYQNKQIMAEYGESLAVYAGVLPAREDEAPMYQTLINSGAFTLRDTVSQTFVTPLPVVRSARDEAFAFDDCTVRVQSVYASFLQVAYDLTRESVGEERENARIRYELRDQTGAALEVTSRDHWPQDGVMRYTGEARPPKHDVTAVTFVPFTGDDDARVYDLSHAFTVTLR